MCKNAPAATKTGGQCDYNGVKLEGCELRAVLGGTVVLIYSGPVEDCSHDINESANAAPMRRFARVKV